MAKGAQTKERVLDRAFRLASRAGLEGLSIGTLAAELGLSKSGLFAHFGSKEALQVELLAAARVRFEEAIFRPALRAKRGLPRLRALFRNWLGWLSDPALPGGCPFVAAAVELDDKEGRPRDYLVSTQRELQRSLAKAARLAVDEGHFRADLDCEQFAFDLYAIVLACHHTKRLLRDPKAEARATTAFESLIASSIP